MCGSTPLCLEPCGSTPRSAVGRRPVVDIVSGELGRDRSLFRVASPVSHCTLHSKPLTSVPRVCASPSLVACVRASASSLCCACCGVAETCARNGSRKSHVFISSHMVAEPVFIHGSSVDCVGEPSERALVVERLARQTAEVAQQTVGTWPAGVDAEEIGTLPMFSGDVDSSEQIKQRALVPVESYNPVLLRKVQSDDGLDAAASALLIVIVLFLPFSCAQLRKVCCRSSRVQTDAVQPSVVNQLLPERSQRFVHESWSVHCSCDRLTPANQLYSTIFSSVFSCQQCCQSRAARRPSHFSTHKSLLAAITSRRQTPVTHRTLHQVYPSIIQQFSHFWHTPARRVHWVLVQEMSTHD